MGRLHCPHCRSVELVERGDQFMCGHCQLFFDRDGEPWVPDVCGRCDAPIAWTGDRYDCSRCGRKNFGPFPREGRTRMTEPEGGFVANSPGGVPGRSPHLAVPL